MDKKSRELVMGKLYLKNKDYKMAERNFMDCLNANPQDTTAMKLLAQVHEHNRRFDKALELYERCYATEPERTGVLLDICRVLQVIGEPGDYRKWLNLGLKAFPSSPIVMNLKSFMNTQPIEKRDSVTIRESSPKPSTSLDDYMAKILDKISLLEKKSSASQSEPQPRSSNDDYMAKILDKLSSIEKRLTTLEQNQNQSQKLNQNPGQIQKPPPPTSWSVSPSPVVFSNTSPKVTPPTQPAPTIAQQPPVSNIFSDSIANPPPATTPTVIPTPASTLFSGFSNLSATPLPTTFGPPPTSSIFTPSNITLPTPILSQTSKTVAQPSPLSNILNNVPTLTAPATTPAATQASTPVTQNMFANSVAKLNLGSSSWAPTGFGIGSSPNKAPQPLFSSPQPLFSSPQPFSFTQTLPNSDKSAHQQKEENGDDDDDGKVPNEEQVIEQTCDMQPIEIKTGEEDEDVIFEYRCKLFRLRDKEYKERGLGNIKVLKHRKTGKGRLVMRRDAIGLVCLNCWNLTKIERASNTQVRWIAPDLSDGDLEMTIFLVKFKTSETTDEFISHLNSLFPDANDSITNTSIASQQTNNGTKEGGLTNKTSDKSEVEIIDPKLDQNLVDKARQLQLPDLFYHTLKNNEPHGSDCGGCKDD